MELATLLILLTVLVFIGLPLPVSLFLISVTFICFTLRFNGKANNNWSVEKHGGIETDVEAVADWYDDFIADQQSAILANLIERVTNVIENERARSVFPQRMF